VAVSADTLPTELQLLKAGYVAALVGQRPFEMGEKTMDTLLALHESKPVQEIIYYTGVGDQGQCRRRDLLLAALIGCSQCLVTQRRLGAFGWPQYRQVPKRTFRVWGRTIDGTGLTISGADKKLLCEPNGRTECCHS
jgi:hypothetical protein